MGLRERKKKRTRAALADAAAALFLERGFEATTIDEIAARAGVSRRTFFRYFPTKDAAFFANQEERLERFRDVISAPGGADDVWRRACHVLLELASDYLEDVRGAVAWHEALSSSPLLQARDLSIDATYEALLREALLDAGLDELEASVRAGALMGMVRGTLAAWYRRDAQDDLVGMGRRALALLHGGLPPLS